MTLQSPPSEFNLRLSIHKELSYGENMGVMGDTNKVGNWKDPNPGRMTWTEGHIWVLDIKVDLHNPVLMYKYVVLNRDKHPSKWEGGFNRVADLLLLHNQQNKSKLELHDTWESYTVNFSIYYPLQDDYQEYMRINGATEQLGDWKYGKGPLVMEKSEVEVIWLTGQLVKPWNHFVTFDQNQCPKRI
jgi:hypothetical protein